MSEKPSYAELEKRIKELEAKQSKEILQGQISQLDLLNNILSNVPASIFWKDRNSVFLGANTRFAQDAGVENPQELIGKTDYDMAWTTEQADFYRECDRKVMDSGEPMLNIEESQQQADGRKIELLTNKVPLRDSSGQVTGLLGIYMDITKLKQTENTLRKSETRLKTLFNSAPELIFVVNPEGEIIKANRQVYEQLGFKEAEVIGANIAKFSCDCNFTGLREGGYTQADVELVGKDGRVMQMDCSATAMPDEDGNLSTYLIIQRDVTERKKAAAALANSEQRFRVIFDSIYQLVGVLDPDGILLQANKTALEFGGIKKEDVVGRPFWDTYWWCYSADVQNRLKAAVKDAAAGKPVRYEENVRGDNNIIRTIDFTLKPVTNQHGETVLIIPEGRDITDAKRAEEELQLRRQEIAHVIRLSTMGEMASGMAHELNQPLMSIVSYCGTASSLVQSLTDPPPELEEILGRASVQAHRAASVIQHLREFVGKDSDYKQPIDIDQVIGQINDLLGSELKNASVILQHDLDGKGCKVMANSVQIEQVLVNLVRNSIEAIKGAESSGGKIILKTCVARDEAIEVTVMDNGPGIDANMIGRVFDPFQTSKASGMGMGLPISRSIIEGHGGRIWVDEGNHDGVSFGISLPICN